MGSSTWPFSSPEAVILLDSGPLARTDFSRLHRVLDCFSCLCFTSQSNINGKTENSQRSQFLVLTNRNAASGDENAVWQELCFSQCTAAVQKNQLNQHFPKADLVLVQ